MKNKLLFIFASFYLCFFTAIAEAAKVNEADFAKAISNEFVENGVEKDVELEFFGGQTAYEIKENQSYKILISALKYDEQQNKFACKAEVYADGKLIGTSDFSGKYYLMEEVYVPATTIKKGDTIREKDLKIAKIRTNRIKNTNVIEKDKLVNKEAKRPLKIGKMILDNEIGVKIIMRKGAFVTAVYVTPNMQITTKAQVLSDGAKGDRIDLLNTKSKKILYGEVIDAETVNVDVQ